MRSVLLDDWRRPARSLSKAKRARQRRRIIGHQPQLQLHDDEELLPDAVVFCRV